MDLRKTAVSAALALMLALQSAVSVFADNSAAAGTAAAAEDKQTVSVSDSINEAIASGGEIVCDTRAAEAAAEKAEEESFLEKNPELAELGQYVFKNDTLPCSENDPSYHKYIRGVMDSLKNSETYVASLTQMGARLLSTTVYGASRLIHQDRFQNCQKSYGIDVSYFQGKIDWNKVKAEGISFAIIRVGFRGYSRAGNLVLDDKFYEYLRGAKEAGLEVGVYFYTQAITVAEAIQEADFTYRYIKGYKFDLPVYFDMETVETTVGRLDAAWLTSAQKTAIVEAFCDRIISYGYEAGLYSNPQWLTYYLNAERLQSKYPLWLAHYTIRTRYQGNFNMWQYGKGVVNGVSSYWTDMNVRYHLYTTPSKIEGLTVSGNISDKAVLTWTAQDCCAGYEVFSRTSSGKVTSLGKTSENTVEIPLASDTRDYYVKGYTIYGGEYIYGDASDSLSLAAFVTCKIISTEQSSNCITLKWTKVDGADSYYIYKYNEASKKYTLISSSTENTFKVTGLAPAAPYTFKVRAVSKDETGALIKHPLSAAFSSGTVGEKITGLKFVTKTENSISLQWNKTDSNLEGYEIQVYNPQTLKYTAAALTKDTSYTVTGLAAGTAYTFRIRSYYLNGGVPIYGVASGVLNCATKCGAPTNCAVVSSTSSSYTISWNAPAGANGYMIYAAPAGSTPVKLFETTETGCTVSGLAKGVYKVYIRPYIKCGSTRYYGESSPTLSPVCGKSAPTGLAAEMTQTTASLSWKAVPYASGYKVYIYDRSTQNFNVKGPFSSQTLTYKFSNLTPGIEQRFKIGAVFPDGSERICTPLITATLKPSVTLTAPTNIKATKADDSSVIVTWKAADGAASYKAYLYDESTKSYKLQGKTASTTFTFTGLRTAVIYKIKILSVGSDGKTKSSSVYNITPKPVAPTLSLGSKTETTVTLKWNAVPLCTKYYVYKLDPLNNEFVKIATTSNTSYTVTGLNKGCRNIFKVKSVTVTNAANFVSLYSKQLSVLTPTIKYFKPCSASCITLYQAFDELGLEKKYAYQEKIAIANAIKGYIGTAEQNTAMLNTLKAGKLIIPQF